MRRVWLIVGLVCLAAPIARSQDSGVVDTRQDAEKQIQRLEYLVSGDVGPAKLVVYLRWLADLYVSIGDLDGAQRAYQRLIDFDPYDLTTVNLYGAFLLDHRHDVAAAEEYLNTNIVWAAASEPQPIYLGQTYALHARALRELGRYDDALKASERAVARLDPDAAEDALRTQALSFKALDRRKEAISTLEQLIGLTGGSNADDINALIAIETQARGSINASEFRARLSAIIDKARHERGEAMRRDGAEMVVLNGEGGARLEATLRRGKGPAAVLFVPDLGGRRSVYTPYAQLLSLDGLTTLSLDPRGHGDSRSDSLPSFAELSATQRALIPEDIVTAQRYLRDTLKIPASQIAVIVEGAASADVEHAMHDLNLGAIVVHLSPVFDQLDRDVAAAIEFRPPLPTLLVASDEDAFSVQSVSYMQAARPSAPITVRTVHASGHGAKILHRPENFAAISAWLTKALVASP